MTVDLYQSPARVGGPYDESLHNGAPRPHWHALMDALQELGPDELDRRAARAQGRIRENGITYNVYGDPLGTSRPWQIDLVPFVIDAAEWRGIEAGVMQRAELLSRLLQDLYRGQHLLNDGHLPPALLYANPAFLRPLVGVAVPDHAYLHMLAVDLARSPDGRWWVLANRTQAPSGSGYALENRLIVSDVMPDVFRSANVQRLASFFRAQRDALASLGPRDNPRIVLLTPGRFNETYFEHSYLAKYLNFTLVEGHDLTVRDRCVFLKTVAGLEQVDVILRRVDDTFCDPLELRGDSLLGVSGLVGAIAAGNVQVANALGSGLVETAAIMPFLPGLARHLLQEDLLLPSVATWWCGQPSALEWVAGHLDSLVVKPAFASLQMEPVFGAELGPEQKSALVARMRARPHEYVAQEQVTLSSVPVWQESALHGRSVVLRTYALHTAEGWKVIPGGLARVAEAQGSVVSMQRGGHSKDAWVLSDQPADTFSMLPMPNAQVELRRVSRVVPSSVADNTFWIGRYVERAENVARVLRTMLPRVYRAEAPELSSLYRLQSSINSRHSKLPKRKRTPQSFAVLEKELRSMLAKPKRPDSLPATLNEVARIAGSVRERLSADMMLLIGQLSADRISGAGPVPPRSPLPDFAWQLTSRLELLSAFSGLERENINRNSGWLFMSIGRRLERAVSIVRQLRQLTQPLPVEDWPYLEFLLEVADSSMTYRARYYTTLQPLPVLDMLLTDESNPRSLDFQLDHLAELYEKLPRYLPADLHSMQSALATLRAFDLQAFQYPTGPDAKSGSDGLKELDRFLSDLQGMLFSWSDNLSRHYFSHARVMPNALENG